MVLHTIVALDDVFAPQQPLPQLEYKQIGSRFVQGVTSQQGFAVSRIISTDPADYLNPQYQIGSIIK